MDYYFTKILSGSFENIEAKLVELLKDAGFGVITQIDMQQTLKNKLNVGFRNYKILGACNPEYAHKALQVEDKIGTMLPCNFIIQELSHDTVEVSAINPMVSMEAIHNETLKDLAQGISYKLENVINNLDDEE